MNAYALYNATNYATLLCHLTVPPCYTTLLYHLAIPPEWTPPLRLYMAGGANPDVDEEAALNITAAEMAEESTFELEVTHLARWRSHLRVGRSHFRVGRSHFGVGISHLGVGRSHLGVRRPREGGV